MKKSEHYAKQIKQLLSKLRQERVKTTPPAAENPMDELLHGILSTYASETKADAALGRLKTGVVDLNEMRVSSVAELVGILGPEYPFARPAAQEIVAALHAIFNRTHSLDLSFLKTSSIKTAEGFLGGLDGLGLHARSWVLLRCLGARVMPIDQNMLTFLQRSGCIAEDATIEEAQKLLTAQVSERELLTMYLTFKRHAASHSPRKAAPPKEPPTPKKQEAPAPAAHPSPKSTAVKASPRPPATRRPAPKPPPPRPSSLRARPALRGHRSGKKSR